MRLEQPIDVAKRNVDGHCDVDPALLDLRHDLQLSRERAIRLGLRGHDPRLRLHADRQRERGGVDMRLCSKGSRGAKFQPQIGHAGGRRAERDRAAHLGPFLPCRELKDGIVAQARL